MRIRILLSVLILFLINTLSVSAASLYFDPQSGTYAEGRSFSIKVRVENQDECINAAQIIINYPNTSIRAVDVARGGSIFSLWTEEPTIDHDNGRIIFSGGLPGGYCGRVDGDPGLTNVIAEIIFQVPGFSVGEKGPDKGSIEFDAGSVVLLNDGRGTPASLTFGTSVFGIVPPGEGRSDYDWFEVIRGDDIRPEPFSIELVRDESIQNSKWFIVFNTIDKQSGIDYFEVYESSIENEGFVVGKKEQASSWKKVEKIPYILEDQTLNSIIRVRAIDKAGNDRLAGYIPDESLRKHLTKPLSQNIFYTVGIGVFVIIILIIVFLMYRKMRKKKMELRDTIVNENNKEQDLPIE